VIPRNSHRRAKRRQLRPPTYPIRHAFIEVAGDLYMMVDWFELEDGDVSRDEIRLVRLTAKELKVYDECRTTADSVGNVLPLVRKRMEGR
jgi:hypothetical protein